MISVDLTNSQLPILSLYCDLKWPIVISSVKFSVTFFVCIFGWKSKISFNCILQLSTHLYLNFDPSLHTLSFHSIQASSSVHQLHIMNI